ncbi:MAG: M23 family metallopeptidase, partial [Rhodospirillales bacterium]|nr:M23 family metallopeptidase [Rhodospirillales bacterium]
HAVADTNGVPVSRPFGAPAPYGESRHPGNDFDVPKGTPIIAAADGVVKKIKTPCPGEPYCGGLYLQINHVDGPSGKKLFIALYAHLQKVLVNKHEAVKRGQLIGLSGSSNNGYAHLHFGLIQPGGRGILHSETYDPADYWLNGKPQCYDPTKDYAEIGANKLTHPVACAGHAETLLEKGGN